MLRSEARQLGLDEAAFLEESAERPLNRLGSGEDIARAVLYFASDDSAWVTGSTLVVDGGGLA
jgi:NAD(P)-dependent dehydrogenase (short-subunit alcohol dehydrogenase family)